MVHNAEGVSDNCKVPCSVLYESYKHHCVLHKKLIRQEITSHDVNYRRSKEEKCEVRKITALSCNKEANHWKGKSDFLNCLGTSYSTRLVFTNSS